MNLEEKGLQATSEENRVLVGDLVDHDHPEKVYAIIFNCDECSKKYHYKYRSREWQDFSDKLFKNRKIRLKPCFSDFWDNTVLINFKI